MTTKEMIEVMQAYERGEQIEYRENPDRYLNLDEWRDASGIVWDWYDYEYRIKPKPTCRPYKDAAEFLAAQKEHGMYLIQKSAATRYELPTSINDEKIVFILPTNNSCKVYAIRYYYDTLLKDFVWQDGTPCGVEE